MNYIGNVRQWKQLIEVDWLGQYVKALLLPISIGGMERLSFAFRLSMR